MTGKAQDFPTSEGYWAFDGQHRVNWGSKPLQRMYHVLEYVDVLDADEAPYPAIRIAGDPFGTLFWHGKEYPAPPIDIGGLQWEGKWTRVYMPWEAQQPIPTPLSGSALDICETAIIESMGNRGAMTEAEFEQWQAQCKAALGEVQAAMRGEQQPAPSVSVPEGVREAIEYALHEGWDDYNQTLPEALAHRSVLLEWLDEQEAQTDERA